MGTPASSLHDDQKRADRAAVARAFEDPAVVELLEKMASSCKDRRGKGDKRCMNPMMQAMFLIRPYSCLIRKQYQLEIEVLPNRPVSRTMILIKPHLVMEGDLTLATHMAVYRFKILFV
jgi:hypothetical protein